MRLNAGWEGAGCGGAIGAGLGAIDDDDWAADGGAADDGGARSDAGAANPNIVAWERCTAEGGPWSTKVASGLGSSFNVVASAGAGAAGAGA